MEQIITVTFQRHDGIAERTEDISLDLKLSECREAVQALLLLSEKLSCKLVLEGKGTGGLLRENATFREAGIQQNDKIKLFPLEVWQQKNGRASVPEKYPPLTQEYQTSPSRPSESAPTNTTSPSRNSLIVGGLIISTLIVLGLVLTRTSQPSAKQHIPQPSSSTEPSAAPPTPVVSPQPSVAPAPVASPQPSVASRQSPEQFVRDQYSIINNRQYQAAWSRLSTGFQNNPTVFPDGYTSYVNWWNTVKQVDVQSVKRVNTNDKTNTVAIRLKYYMNNGKVYSESRRILLLWNAETSSWIIQSVEQSLTNRSNSPPSFASEPPTSQVISPPPAPVQTAIPQARSPQVRDYSWLSDRRVTQTDLAGKTAFELNIMRNTIFARHGRRFRSPELQSYLNSQSWYRPRYSP